MPEDKRIRLLEAAMSCFTRAGFHGTTTADVAREAAMATGTLFTYYPSKERLVDAALHEANARLFSFAPRPPTTPDEPLRGALARSWHAWAHRALAAPPAFHYWVLFWATPGLPRGPEQVPFPALRGLSEALTERRAVGPAEGRALHALFVSHWQGAVRWALALPGAPAGAPDPRREAVLARTFDAWWALAGLPDDMLVFRNAGPAPAAPQADA